ncbi:MAG: hypothetical protein ACI8QZ_000024 [Chlamydiales bacterium]|jgi:hypothetical protein
MTQTERASQLQRATRDLGVLHYILTYLDRDFGLQPVEVLTDLLDDLKASPTSLPNLNPLLDGPIDMGTLREGNRARASWGSLHAECVSWAQTRYGLADTSAWDTVLKLQTAVMPACGRAYPEAVEVAHDFVAWFTARCRHGREACSLESYDSGQLLVRDPWGLSNAWSADRARAHSSRWELDSPLLEARAHYQVPEDQYSRTA